MRKRLLILPLLLIIFSGCGMWKPETSYPAIEAGLRMTQWQMSLQSEYNEVKPYVTPEQQKYMEEVIAPLLDKAKYQIWVYNEAVLNDERPLYTETQIRQLLREISFKMLSPKEEEASNDYRPESDSASRHSYWEHFAGNSATARFFGR